LRAKALAPEAAMVPFAGLLAALEQIPDRNRRLKGTLRAS
jgi:hypothetical protein